VKQVLSTNARQFRNKCCELLFTEPLDSIKAEIVRKAALYHPFILPARVCSCLALSARVSLGLLHASPSLLLQDLSLWRIGVYDVFSLLRKPAHQSSPAGAKARDRMLQLLDEASGVYIRLYQHVYSTFGGQLPGQASLSVAVVARGDSQVLTPTHRSAVMAACHRWLICLGDLARYHASALKSSTEQVGVGWG
jgi:hypothetical protein